MRISYIYIYEYKISFLGLIQKIVQTKKWNQVLSEYVNDRVIIVP